jgi:putative ABC transport system permease protein
MNVLHTLVATIAIPSIGRDRYAASMTDLRDATRALRRRPAFTVMTILVLALGIGANTAMFSLFDAVILRALPFREPDRLVWAWHRWAGGDTGVFAIPDLLEYRARNRSLDGLAAFTGWGANVTDRGDAERLTGIRVTGNFFSLLGTDAALGRALGTGDELAGSPRAVVVSYRLWQRKFGGEPAAVGQPVTLNGDAYTLVGVMPASFVFPMADVDIAVPLVIDLDPFRANSGMNFLRILGRLKSSTDIRTAEAELTTTTARLRELDPVQNAGKYGVRLVPMHDEITGNHRPLLLTLLGAVMFVLLLMCTNLANLLLAQATERRKEFALRTALGSGRGRLVRQLLWEAALLSLAGGLAGALLAWASIRTLIAWLPAALPRGDHATIDPRVLAFTILLSLIAGLLFGAWPAVRAAGADPIDAMRSQDRGAAARTSRVESMLLGGQIALALTLLVGAGLYLRSFNRLQSVAPGFTADEVLTIRLALPRRSFNDPAAIARFHDTLIQRLTTEAGAVSASMISILPLSGARSTNTFSIKGRPAAKPGENPIAHYRVIGADYFDVMRIPLRAGRGFNAHDTADAPAVAIVNEAAARRFWPDADPIGAVVELDTGADRKAAQIVGVVGDTKHLGLETAVGTDLFIPIGQMRQLDVPSITSSVYLVARAATDPRVAAEPVVNTIKKINSSVAASAIRTMPQVIDIAVAPRRFAVRALEVFATAALLLAVAGVYALTAQLVQRRRREIAIRIAVGARQREILQFVAARTWLPVAAGVAAGLLGAHGLTQLIKGALFQFDGFDPVVIGSIALLMVGVAAAAAGVPALRASWRLPQLHD